MKVYGRGNGIEVGPGGHTVMSMAAAQRYLLQHGLDPDKVLEDVRIPVRDRMGLRETIKDLCVRVSDGQAGMLNVTGTYKYKGTRVTQGWVLSKEIDYRLEKKDVFAG